MTVVDGRIWFGCSLQDFYMQPILVSNAARRGVLIPPITDLAKDASAGLARIDVIEGAPRWIVDCPDCGFGKAAEYVWIEGPHQMFCIVCANQSIGRQWRPVKVPSHRKQIEAALAARPAEHRNWKPWESVAVLKAENDAMGWKG